jgi:hypothetical protein
MRRGLPARCARRRQKPRRTREDRWKSIEPTSRTKNRNDPNRTGGTALQANRCFAWRNAGVLSETSKGSSGVPATGGAKIRGRNRLDGERFQLKSKSSGRRHASSGPRNPEAACCKRCPFFATRGRKTRDPPGGAVFLEDEKKNRPTVRDVGRNFVQTKKRGDATRSRAP